MDQNEDQEAVATEPGVAPLDDEVAPEDEAVGETPVELGIAPFDDEAAGEGPVEPCAECAALRAELELKAHLVTRLETALGRPTFDIVVDNSGAVIGPHSFEPGHKLAEVKICEDCVSVQWIVDAVRGGRARAVASGG